MSQIDTQSQHEQLIDGMCVIGKLQAVREIRRTKGDNSVIEGIANIDFETSRGIETIQAQKIIKTMMGTFDKTEEFNTLTAPQNVGKHYSVALGKVVAGAFTNWVALFVKEF